MPTPHNPENPNPEIPVLQSAIRNLQFAILPILKSETPERSSLRFLRVLL
jgi:hypothetical protein